MLLLLLSWLKEASSLPSQQYYEGNDLCFGFMNTLYLDQTVLLPSPEANSLAASFLQLWVKFLIIIFPGLVEEKEVGRGMEGRKIFFQSNWTTCLQSSLTSG